ncbi:V-set domain-containing T-cell activation inhibitor 1 [Clinocottus analis]|uniref:V-set domain-containing T-cell activation inhibitor 1 n=1 Tax=Clinocottus analis TaxID=304258 RepID=UPI0035C05BFD
MATLGQIIFGSMIALIIIFGTAIILILALSLTGQPSEVSSLDTTPIANLGIDELLSCYLNAESQPARLREVSVTWAKAGRTVYQYRDGAPALGNQDPQFRGRTQLFPKALPAGNASLLLRSVRRDDAGDYTCSVSSSSGSGEVTVHLRTAAFSAPTFKLSGSVLMAEAPRWFPQPNVTWSDFSGAVLNSSTSAIANFMGSFRINSSLQPVNVGAMYGCRIQNDLVTAESKASVTESGVTGDTYFTFTAASSSLASTHLSFIACALCIYCIT